MTRISTTMPSAPSRRAGMLAAAAIALLLCATWLGSCKKSAPPVRTAAEPPEAAEQGLTILFGGDIMLDWGIKNAYRTHGAEYLLGGIKKELDRYDFRVANLECPIAYDGDPDPEKKYLFLGDPADLPLLAYAGVNAVFLANNHSTDYGETALADTIIHLRLNGIAVTGAGEDIETARRPVILRKHGISVALLGYSSIGAPSVHATVNRGGVAPAFLLHIKNDIQRIRAKVDYIVVGLHWGREYSGYPERQQIALAHAIIESGADAIVGHHPHIYQGIEIHDGRPIIYSLGNFIFGSINEDIRDNILVGITFERDGLHSLRIVPITRNNASRNAFQYRLLDSDAAGAVFRHLLDLSHPLGDDFPESAFQEGPFLHYSFDP